MPGISLKPMTVQTVLVSLLWCEYLRRTDVTLIPTSTVQNERETMASSHTNSAIIVGEAENDSKSST